MAGGFFDFLRRLFAGPGEAKTPQRAKARVVQVAPGKSAAPNPARPAAPVPPPGQPQGPAVAPPDDEAARFVLADLSDPALAALFDMCRSETAAQLRLRLSPQRPVRKGLDDEDVLPAHTPSAIPPAKELVGREAELVSLPEVLTRLGGILRDPSGSLSEAVDIIGRDASLSARLLKLVNSAFYRRLMQASRSASQTRYDTISRAVSVVGARQLATLALGVAAMGSFKDVPKYLVEMHSFWKHAIACGVIARALADELGETDDERFFVAGLLHDIGRLVMYKQLPVASRNALTLARREGLTLLAAERRIFVWDHGELGGLMLAKWDYPPGLTDMVRRHHEPAQAGSPRAAAIVMAADAVTGALAIGTSGERLVPRLDMEAWKALAVAPDMLRRVVERAGSELEETFASLIDET